MEMLTYQFFYQPGMELVIFCACVGDFWLMYSLTQWHVLSNVGGRSTGVGDGAFFQNHTVLVVSYNLI